MVISPRRQCAYIFYLVFMLMLVLSECPCHGSAERIASINSNIKISGDGTVMVRETIRVVSNGDQIVYGISRDLETAYRDRYLLNHVTECQVQEVTLDGKPDYVNVRSRRYGARIYLGIENRKLTPGEHVYTLAYRLVSPLQKRGDLGGLRWNIWGHRHHYFEDITRNKDEAPEGLGFGYRLPVDKVTIDVTFPSGVPLSACKIDVDRVPGRTRRYEATCCRVEWSSKESFGSDTPIDLTASWPKNYINEAALGNNLRRTIGDNLGLMIALAGFALLTLYYMIVRATLIWASSSRSLVRLSEPPDGISPTDVRYLHAGGYDGSDNKALAVSLVDMAIRGFVSIEERKGVFTVRRTESDRSVLTHDEQQMADILFRKRSSFSVIGSQRRNISRATQAYIRDLVSRSSMWGLRIRTGNDPTTMAIFHGTWIACTVAMCRDSGPWILLLLFFLYGGCLFLWGYARDILRAFRNVRAWQLARTGFSRAFSGILFIMIVIGTAVGVISRFGLPGSFSPLFLVPIAVMFVIAVRVNNISRIPAIASADMLKRIEGFRTYLSEKDGESCLLSTELFEKYLPYALALDVEHDWTQQFTRTSEPPIPNWYSGESLIAEDIETFVALLSGPFVDAISVTWETP